LVTPQGAFEVTGKRLLLQATPHVVFEEMEKEPVLVRGSFEKLGMTISTQDLLECVASELEMVIST